MFNRDRIRWVLGLAALCFLPACASVKQWVGSSDHARPNVILVMTDDQGYGDLSCHGNQDLATPHLDRLHGESVRLTNFHVDPTCAPTRAALLTGRYSLRTGVWHTIAGRSLLRLDEQTLGNVFQANGYRTGMFGKWHLGDNEPYRPQHRGFEETVHHGGGGVGQTPDLWGNDYFDDRYWHNGKAEPYRGYCTDVFFDEAMKFIHANRRQPFFCYLAPNAPHGPYHVEEKYAKPFRDRGIPPKRAAFYGMLTNIDQNMGRLMTHLDDLGLAKNTIVIFMTDNGTAGPWFAKEGKDYTAGLRGIKGSIYEGGHRVPFFMRWPKGGIGGGRDDSSLSAHIDVMPTLVDLCQLKKPHGPEVDGQSLKSILLGQGAPWADRTLVVNNQRIAVPEKWRQATVMTERWRLVNRTELYDLNSDLGQTKNVADQNPQVVARLQNQYEKWWEKCSVRTDEIEPIHVGSGEENPDVLTAHDWHAPKVPWDQSVIKTAPRLQGHWELKVAKSGTYAITLRQQPLEANHPIDGQEAQISVGGHVIKKPLLDGATSVTFAVDLVEGRTKLKGFFVDHKGQNRGAYYAYVTYLTRFK